MAIETNSTNSDAIGGDVTLADLVSSLPDDTSIDSAYLEHFRGTDDEVKETTEAGDVPAEEVAEVEGEELLDPSQPEETPEVEGEEAEAPKEEPASVQKRIDKLTAEKYAAKEEAEQLKAQNAQLLARLQTSQVQVPVTPDNPLSNIHSEQDLATRESQLRAARKFCMLNPDGGMVVGTDDKGQPTETVLSAEKVRELLVQSEELLTEKIPQRREYLRQAAGFNQEARTTYPQLFTNGSEDGQLAVTFLKMAPWVRNFPDWQLVLGDYISGFRQRTNKAKGATASASKKPVPVVKPLGAPRPGAGGTKVPASQKSIRSVISERGELSIDDVASLLQGII